MQVAQREAIVSNTEIARLERDLGQARTAALSSGAGIQSRLQALQIACALTHTIINNFPFSFDYVLFFASRYREQVEKVARLRDETVRAIVKSSTEIAMFKEGISQQLKTLRDIAEAGQ